MLLQYASEQLKDDKDVVRVAVKNNGKALKFASEELKRDKEVVRVAVKNNGKAFKLASKELKGDRELVLAVVQEDGFLLSFASEELRGDREVVLAAIHNYGRALDFASEELRGDREVVLAAIRNYGCALDFASELLQKNEEVAFAAVQRNEKALEYVSEELLHNKLFLIKCYEIHKKRIYFDNYINEYTYHFFKEFDNLENGHFDDDFIEANVDILHLVENKEQLYEYLYTIKKYKIFHDNEEIAEYIKDKYKVIMLSFNKIKPIRDYNIEGETEEVIEISEKEIKQNFRKEFFKINPELRPVFKIIYIDKYINEYINEYIDYFLTEFDNLENGHFNDTFIEENVDILDLVQNKEQLYEYLYRIGKYKIIHDNEEIAEYIKDKYKVIILSYGIIDPENEYDRDELENDHENRNIGLQVIFIL